jgi:hypothetical protein
LSFHDCNELVLLSLKVIEFLTRAAACIRSESVHANVVCL